MDYAELREVTWLFRSLLTVTDDGELDANTSSARALLRKLKGATIALELTLGDEPKPKLE